MAALGSTSTARLAYRGPIGWGFLLKVSEVGFGVLPLSEDVGFRGFLVVGFGVVLVVDGTDGSGLYSGSAGCGQFHWGGLAKSMKISPSNQKIQTKLITILY